MTLPTIRPPDIHNNPHLKNVMWFHGLDPAVKVDFFGVVTHGLMPKPHDQKKEWNPFLARVWEIDHNNFTEIMDWVKNSLFVHFPPKHAVIDSTRDTPTAEDLQRKYGEIRVNAQAMSNTMNYELKQIGYSFLTNGYKWPNTALLKDKKQASAIAELQVQCLQERVEPTRDNRIKFTHPPNKHNDLNRAWEMSLKAVRDFQYGKIGETGYSKYHFSVPTRANIRKRTGGLAGGGEKDPGNRRARMYGGAKRSFNSSASSNIDMMESMMS